LQQSPASHQHQKKSGDRHPQLNVVAEKTLTKKCKSNILAYCPTMDLVALATDDEELHVFRLNGQRVLGVNFASDDPFEYGYEASGENEEIGEVRCAAWKRNGKLVKSVLVEEFSFWRRVFLSITEGIRYRTLYLPRYSLCNPFDAQCRLVSVCSG
jgi:hypothetical protein